MKKLLLFILMASIITAPVRASFDDLGVGARAPGMADTFVGVADDANAIYYNPAGLAQLREQEVMTEYGQLLKGLDDGSEFRTTYLGFAQPLHVGTLGMAYHNLQAANLISERTLFLSYGWRLNIQPFGWRGVWSSGATLKQLHRQYQPDRFTENSLNDAGTASGQPDPIFAKGYGKDAYATDLGGLYQFGREYRSSIGLQIMNVNRPDVSLSGDGDRAPLITKLGLVHRPEWGLMSVEFRRARRLASSPDTDVAFGAERKFMLNDWGAFLLRGGYAEGSRGYKAVTAGMSYVFSRIQLDYAFNFPIGTLTETKGSHRLGFSFRLASPERQLKQSPQELVDLLASFAHDGGALRLILERTHLRKPASNRRKVALLKLAMEMISTEDPYRREILNQIVDLGHGEGLETAPVKDELLHNVTPADHANMDDALNHLQKREVSYALARLALASPASRSDGAVDTVEIMAHTFLAAAAYRENNIDTTLDEVRQLLQALPDDEVVMAAYRQLLGDRVAAPQAPNGTALPEAPSTLVAPPAVGVTPSGPTDRESLTTAYATSLGYYMMRKEAGAPAAERVSLLQQMKFVYDGKGIDLKFVEQELKDLGQTTPQKVAPAAPPTQKGPAPEPKPVLTLPAAPKAPAKVAPKTKPALKKAVPAKAKPAEANLEFDHEWQYYREAVDRGLNDHERIEILESILSRFSGEAAAPVRRELERLRSRVR